MPFEGVVNQYLILFMKGKPSWDSVIFKPTSCTDSKHLLVNYLMTRQTAGKPPNVTSLNKNYRTSYSNDRLPNFTSTYM